MIQFKSETVTKKKKRQKQNYHTALSSALILKRTFSTGLADSFCISTSSSSCLGIFILFTCRGRHWSVTCWWHCSSGKDEHVRPSVYSQWRPSQARHGRACWCHGCVWAPSTPRHAYPSEGELRNIMHSHQDWHIHHPLLFNPSLNHHSSLLQQFWAHLTNTYSTVTAKVICAHELRSHSCRSFFKSNTLIYSPPKILFLQLGPGVFLYLCTALVNWKKKQNELLGVPVRRVSMDVWMCVTGLLSLFSV